MLMWHSRNKLIARMGDLGALCLETGKMPCGERYVNVIGSLGSALVVRKGRFDFFDDG